MNWQVVFNLASHLVVDLASLRVRWGELRTIYGGMI